MGIDSDSSPDQPVDPEVSGGRDADQRSDADALIDGDAVNDPGEGSSPGSSPVGEDLHVFGNKERPREVRLERDLKVDSPDAVVGPYAPSSPADEVRGASMFIDPDRAPLSGHYHVLRPDVTLPDGLGLHADGKDVGGTESWGHRTIYATQAMPAAEFTGLVKGLPWEYAGFKPENR